MWQNWSVRSVLVDARPLQVDAYAGRGVGVHLRSWLAAAAPLQARTGLSISLLVDRALKRLPPGLDHFPRVPVDLSRGELPETGGFDPDATLRDEAALEAAVHAAGADLFHTTYPLAEEFCAARRLSCPHVISLYDTILIDQADTYLKHLTRRERAGFAGRLAAISSATREHQARLQTLSQASAADIARALGIEQSRIDIVSCATDARFRPLPRREMGRLSDIGLSPGFALTVTAAHPSKNFAGLLRGYALIDPALRARHPLVAVLRESPDQAAAHTALIEELGLRGQVMRLSSLSIEDLVSLYNGAAVVVIASIQEGFGLPVLEAMSCGAPVACSNASALPEAGGEAAAYFDPRQPAEIAAVITDVLRTPARQEALRRAGLQQARRFDWTRVAQAVLDSYRRTLDERAPARTAARLPAERRLRLAWWSPLPPVPSGISDYSESLLEALARRENLDITVFVDGYHPRHERLYERIAVWDWRAFPALHARNPFDARLFHFGNSPHHAYMIRALRTPLNPACPVIGVFHDGSLFHLFADGLSVGAALTEIRREQGWRAARAARRAWRAGAALAETHPLLGQLVCQCDAVIAHSDWVARRCRDAAARFGAAPAVSVIPFGIEVFPEDDGRFQRAARQMLGLPQEAVIFGAFGHMHPAKRIEPVIRAFQGAALPNALLYLAGAINDQSPALIQALAHDRTGARRQNIVIEEGYPPYERLLLAMQCVDVGVNLRYPTHGETSATLCGLLGMGKPVIVSDAGAFSEFPDTCVLKMPVDAGEQACLTGYFRTLATDAALRRRLARHARAFAQENSWQTAAERYTTVIRHCVAAAQKAGLPTSARA